ncbi:MAG: FAD-dependent oxidoreductase [Steroidobacteraceae bacterium]|jgi:monoamine oxidase|nr:FAD-dependent oxidoreductase [Steroidobacteraceae bacterium]
MSSSRRRFLQGVSACAATGALGLRPRGSRAAEKTEVLVLGAGLAGLRAALQLQEQGAAVTVLEASARVGGRCRTVTLDGLPMDLGASQIGANYGRVIDAARRAGVKLGTDPRRPGETSFHIGGRLLRKEEWKDSPVNRTVGEERAVLPHVLETAYTFRLNPFGDDVGAWLEPRWQSLDVSAGAWLMKQGVSEAAVELMSVSTDYTDMWNTSALAMLRDVARSQLGGFSGRDRSTPLYGSGTNDWFNFEGGAERLPEAMARQLATPVRFGKAVARIVSEGAKAEVTCLDGSRYTADFVVCSLPFSVLRRVTILPALPPLQAEAVAASAYGGTTHVILEPTRPFWEDDGYGPTMYTDGALERIFAPQIGDRVPFVRAWINGYAADRLDSLPAAELGAFVVRELERMRPAARGRLRVRTVFSWGAEPHALGHRHVFLPGQVSRFAREMDRSWQRIHFCGEHLRRMEFGMESAMETADRVAVEILSA